MLTVTSNGIITDSYNTIYERLVALFKLNMTMMS